VEEISADNIDKTIDNSSTLSDNGSDVSQEGVDNIYKTIDNNAILSNNEGNAENNNEISDNNTISTEKGIDGNMAEDQINIDDLITIIKTAINDDIWYGGSTSLFKGFELFKSDFVLYINNNAPDLFYISFESPVEGIFNQLEYYVIIIGKSEKGYDPELAGFFFDTSIDNLNKRIEDDGFSLYKKGKIEFDKVSQPNFPSISDTRESIFNEITQKITDIIKADWGIHGSYKIYIRNFYDNSFNTYAIIEDTNNKAWLMEITFEENGFISTDKFYEVGEDVDEYTANQYKKVSYEKEVKIQ
jgi:hypothetical protein